MVPYYEYVGSSGTGTFTQSGGTNSISGYNGALYLGYAPAAAARTSSAAAASCRPREYVGSSGTGSFTQTGGTNIVSLLSIGSSGSYLLAGGSLQVKAVS